MDSNTISNLGLRSIVWFWYTSNQCADFHPRNVENLASWVEPEPEFLNHRFEVEFGDFRYRESSKNPWMIPSVFAPKVHGDPWFSAYPKVFHVWYIELHLPYNSTKWRYIDIPYMDGMGYGIWRAFLERKWNLYISFRFTSNLMFIVFRLPCSGTSLSWSAKYETLDCYHSKCCI